MMVEGKEKKGTLPDGWRWVSLGKLCTFKHGGTPSKANESYWVGDIPWVSPKDMYSPVITETTDHISQQAVNESSTRVVSKDTILTVVRSGVLAHTFPVCLAGRDLAFNQDIKAIQANSELLDVKFLVFSLKWLQPKILHEGIKKGATVHSMRSGFLESLLVPLPPIEEQRRIVAILSERLAAVDQARQATQAQLEAAQALPAAYLREIFNSPEAQTWEKKSLGGVASISTGTTPSTKRKDYYQGEIPFIKTAEVVNNRIKNTSVFVSQEAVKDFRLKIYPIGTVLMAMYGQGKTRGQVSILDIPATTTQNAAAIVPSEAVLSEYIWYWLRGRYEHLRRMGFQGDLSHLSLEIVKNLQIPLPSTEIQKKLTLELDSKFATARDLKQSLQDQLDTINALPAALLRQAFSGEL